MCSAHTLLSPQRRRTDVTTILAHGVIRALQQRRHFAAAEHALSKPTESRTTCLEVVPTRRLTVPPG